MSSAIFTLGSEQLADERDGVDGELRKCSMCEWLALALVEQADGESTQLVVDVCTGARLLKRLDAEQCLCSSKLTNNNKRYV